MKITLTSIPVKDQDKALKFYTEILGFEKKEDVPMGEYRWITVVSPEGIEGVELALEPLGFAPAADFQKALFESNIPYTLFESNDIESEVARLKELGVVFKGDVKESDGIAMATFDDTCGNLIMLMEKKG